MEGLGSTLLKGFWLYLLLKDNIVPMKEYKLGSQRQLKIWKILFCHETDFWLQKPHFQKVGQDNERPPKNVVFIGGLSGTPDWNRTNAPGSGGRCSIHWATGAYCFLETSCLYTIPNFSKKSKGFSEIFSFFSKVVCFCKKIWFFSKKPFTNG